MVESRTSRAQYTEMEAAAILGISVEELRKLVTSHIVKDEEAAPLADATYHSSDLLVLRILAAKRSAET